MQALLLSYFLCVMGKATRRQKSKGGQPQRSGDIRSAVLPLPFPLGILPCCLLSAQLHLCVPPCISTDLVHSVLL